MQTPLYLLQLTFALSPFRRPAEPTWALDNGYYLEWWGDTEGSFAGYLVTDETLESRPARQRTFWYHLTTLFEFFTFYHNDVS